MDAKDYCMTEYGSSLASFHSEEDISEISSKINNDSYYYIGLVSNSGSHGIWVSF